jgi:hypothetical protein
MVMSGKSMNWVSVDSSVFASVAYCGDERQLFLRFHSGKVYRYFGFPPDQYDELLAAESKGGYFAESIRGNFSTKRFVRPMAARVEPYFSWK